MKFIHCLKKQGWIVLLFTFALSFSSCQGSEENIYLEYGQIQWGMPPEKVFEFLEVSQEDIVTRDAVEDVEYYLLENVEFCGEKTLRMALNFMKPGYREETGESGGLVEIYAYYPEDTDMGKVGKEMKKIYGDSISEIYEYERSSISPNQIQEDRIRESETVKVWAGPKLSRVLKEKTFHQYRKAWLPFHMEMQEETWEQFKKNARLVTGEWVNLPGEGGKTVHFDAYNLAVYQKITE